uniref:WD_REPEATS_REGION domain-containing protein n=1 Tax=Syphacia muris TaxID=451379 RepID=A0A0N5AJ03_9BILA
MGITKQYLRYVPAGTCNIVSSTNGALTALDSNVCAASACEKVYFFNLRTGEKFKDMGDVDKAVTALKFSNDKRFLAIGYSDGVIRIFDRKNIYILMRINLADIPVITFAGHKTGVNCIAFSRDGLMLASGGKDSAVIVWSIVNECGICRLNGHKGSVTQLQFTADGNFLVSSSKDSFVKFWNIASQSCFFTLAESRSEVYTFALVNNDSLLMLGTAALEVLVFELFWLNSTEVDNEENGANKKLSKLDVDEEHTQANRFLLCKKKGELLRHSKGRARQFAVSHDERIVTCLGSSDIVDIFRVYSAEESEKRITKKLKKAVKRKDGSGDSLTREEIAKDVTVLVSHIGDYHFETKVKWIDFCPFSEPRDSEVISYKFFALLVNNTIYNASLNIDFKYNLIETSIDGRLDKLGHRTDVRCLAVAESDFGFASGSSESIIVWNRHSLNVIHECEDEEMKNVTALLFLPTDKHIIAGTKEGNMFLFELATNQLINTFKKAHDAAIWVLRTTPDKKGCISCSSDKRIKYWTYVIEPGTKRIGVEERRNLEISDEVLCISPSQNSKFLAAGLLDNTARLYFVDSFKLAFTLYGHALPVTCIDFSFDSKLVITGSADKSVRIWGADYGDCHKHLLGHTDIVTCVQFVPNELLFWSAGKDGLLIQWDAEKFQRIQVLNSHFAEIWAIAQTINGKYLVSASHDKSVRLWELTEQIIVLQEEEEMEREKEYEERLISMDDVIPGEENDGENETSLAAKKSIHSIRSAEDIIEAVEIFRTETAAKADDPNSAKHPLVAYLRSKSLNNFILDVISKVPSSHLEKSLLMVPFSFVPDILRALNICVTEKYKVELATRVILFLIRCVLIHFNHITNSADMVSVIDSLRTALLSSVNEIKNIYGFNFAALNLLQKEIEDSRESRMFTDISQYTKKSKKKVKKAIIKTVV